MDLNLKTLEKLISLNKNVNVAKCVKDSSPSSRNILLFYLYPKNNL